MFAKPYSNPTGYVFLEAFDEGIRRVMAGLGSEIGSGGSTGGATPTPSGPGSTLGPGPTTASICPDNAFYVPIPAKRPGDKDLFVTVVAGNADQALSRAVFPLIVIRRTGHTPAMQRWHSVGCKEYFAGVSGTLEVIGGVSGYGLVETKPQAIPFDIFYSVQLFSRHEREALQILRHLMRRFPVFGSIPVRDSLGDLRTYDTLATGSFNDISEIVDISERVRGYSFDVTVLGELDLNDAEVSETVSTVDVQVGVSSP